MRRQRFFATVGALMVVVGVTFGVGIAAAQPFVNHGITLTKGCSSPTPIGVDYSCSYQILNFVDGAQDTLTIDGLLDTVHASGGDVQSGGGSAAATFSQLKFEIVAGSPSCNGSGSGSNADPFVNATVCTLPFGSVLAVQPFSFYVVQPLDFNLGGHVLQDDVALSWHDLCDDPAGTANTNCVTNPPTVGSASQSVITQLPSTTSTTIHDGAHGPVTVVEAGTTVHDFVSVDGGGGNPPATGDVTIDWFANSSCTGAPASTSAPIALGPGGTVDASGFARGPLAAGFYGFRAHYLGDPGNPRYEPSDGPCEPLQVVDANIQITPPTAVNPVGTNHTLTGHVNLNDGSGFVNAPAGTLITFTLVNTGGASAVFVGPDSCTTSGGTGSCTVVISSPTAGTTTIRAITDVTVATVPLHRETGDGLPGDSNDAVKTWNGGKNGCDAHDRDPKPGHHRHGSTSKSTGWHSGSGGRYW
jgi:hypothetical protein